MSEAIFLSRLLRAVRSSVTALPAPFRWQLEEEKGADELLERALSEVASSEGFSTMTTDFVLLLLSSVADAVVKTDFGASNCLLFVVMWP
jgi:hypothetical protein